MSIAAAQSVIPTMKQAPAIKMVALLPIFLHSCLPPRILDAFTQPSQTVDYPMLRHPRMISNVSETTLAVQGTIATA